MEIEGEVGREIEIAAATTFMTNLMLNCARQERERERVVEGEREETLLSVDTAHSASFPPPSLPRLPSHNGNTSEDSFIAAT